MKSRFYGQLFTGVSLAIAILLSQTGYGQTYSGNTTSNWAVGSTWDGGVAPTNGATNNFGQNPVNTTSVNDISNLTVNGINFTNGGVATISSATNASFVLNGNRVVFGGNINASAVAHDGTITGNRVLRDFINFDMNLSGIRTITTGQLGAINVDQTQHHLTINGTIGETTPGQFITKAGGATLTLNANNTFTGSTRINSGIVEVPFIANAGTPQPLGLSGNLSIFTGSVSVVSPGNSPFVLTNHTISLIGTNNQNGVLLNNSANPNAAIVYNGTFQNSVSAVTELSAERRRLQVI